MMMQVLEDLVSLQIPRAMQTVATNLTAADLAGVVNDVNGIRARLETGEFKVPWEVHAEVSARELSARRSVAINLPLVSPEISKSERRGAIRAKVKRRRAICANVKRRGAT